MLIKREEEKKPEKEERFFTRNVCSRNNWVKKLLQAKNTSFELDDCGGVPMEELIALQRDIESSRMSEVVIKKRRPTDGTEIGLDDLAASAASVEYFGAESELQFSGDE